ncbi:MAG: LAGLIDADG family homing endonuclease, partial [Candidatus Aenigmatarchaeota archaeon]
QFKKDMIRIFGDIKAYHYCYRNRNRGLMVVGFPSITGIILMKILGPMAGDLKHVPNVIVNSDKKSKALYLRALFDDEGCVSSKRVCIVMSNKNVMETVKDMLKEFSIETGEIAKRCFGDKWKTSFRVEIFGEHDIKLFAKEINFSHPDKKKKLRTFLEEYVHKKPKYKKGETSKLILEILKKNEMGVNEIAKQLNRKPGHRLREQLHKLGKEGKIKSRKERNLNIYYIDSKSRKV